MLTSTDSFGNYLASQQWWYVWYVPYGVPYNTPSSPICIGNTHVFNCPHCNRCECGQATRLPGPINDIPSTCTTITW